MVLDHWGMSVAPFGNGTSQRLGFHAPREEALARLNYLVENGRRVGLLSGDAGCGKSQLLATFAKQHSQMNTHVVTINLCGRSPGELLWDIANQLGTVPKDQASEGELWRTIARRVQENRWVHQKTVLLIDDATLGSPDTRPLLARLLEIDSSPNALWTIILACEPTTIASLGAQLLSHVALRVDLLPFTLEESEHYLQSAVQASGCRDEVFTPNAIRTLHQLSQGVPRELNRLADLALIAGAGRGLDKIDSETIEFASEELLVH